MTAGPVVRIKRVYDDAADDDGVRVLVDRLWPRGVRREDAHLDAWLKEIAPTPELRTWWNHDPDRLDDFAARYRRELAANPALDELRELTGRHPVVTLLYAAKDPEINHAAVLRDTLEESR
ncbi:DUF488 domain-containing protein [Myceligenerans crystallogenes]|uniref:DUF488 domain-containing protein n=1 Tax=Myceligenerans crystallogenes TaxID=316335 RepID=UPI0031D051A8